MRRYWQWLAIVALLTVTVSPAQSKKACKLGNRRPITTERPRPPDSGDIDWQFCKIYPENCKPGSTPSSISSPPVKLDLEYGGYSTTIGYQVNGNGEGAVESENGYAGQSTTISNQVNENGNGEGAVEAESGNGGHSTAIGNQVNENSNGYGAVDAESGIGGHSTTIGNQVNENGNGEGAVEAESGNGGHSTTIGSQVNENGDSGFGVVEAESGNGGHSTTTGNQVNKNVTGEGAPGPETENGGHYSTIGNQVNENGNGEGVVKPESGNGEHSTTTIGNQVNEYGNGDGAVEAQSGNGGLPTSMNGNQVNENGNEYGSVDALSGSEVHSSTIGNQVNENSNGEGAVDPLSGNGGLSTSLNGDQVNENEEGVVKPETGNGEPSTTTMGNQTNGNGNGIIPTSVSKNGENSLYGSGDNTKNEINNNNDNVNNNQLHSNQGAGVGVGNCTCVPYYLCNDNNDINEDGTNLIDIRMKESECPHYLHVCCGSPSPDPSHTPHPSHTPPTATTPSLLIPPKCGRRNSKGIGFTIKGDKDGEAQYGEFPWMVAVLRGGDPEATLYRYQCGGSLVHPKVVLTATHCVRGKDNLVIRAGEWDTQTTDERYPTQDRNVTEVITHEEFYGGSLANDPALLILAEPVAVGEGEGAPHVGLVCLPQPWGGGEGEPVADGRQCVASGWGQDKFGKEGEYQAILKRVELPVVGRARCEAALRRTKLGPRFRLHHSFMCAGGVTGKDTCKGDGGSPLVCPGESDADAYEQVGIVAWGVGCGSDVPAVYVSVPHFRRWIDDKLRLRGISIE